MAAKQKKYNFKKKESKKAQKKESIGTKNTEKKGYAPPSEITLQLLPYFFVLLAFFIVLCLLATSFTGWLGGKVKLLLAGLFSWGAYLIPPVLVARAFSFRKEAVSRHPYRNWILSLVFIISFSAFIATAKAEVQGRRWNYYRLTLRRSACKCTCTDHRKDHDLYSPWNRNFVSFSLYR